MQNFPGTKLALRTVLCCIVAKDSQELPHGTLASTMQLWRKWANVSCKYIYEWSSKLCNQTRTQCNLSVYLRSYMQQYYRVSRKVTVWVRVEYKVSLSWLQDLFPKSCDYDTNNAFIPNWLDGYSCGSFTINVAKRIPFQNTCWYRSDHLLIKSPHWIMHIMWR